ncbi:MAG: T9SS type A sorting domain-containing protein [Bacteroidia bacterium]|nr:T9SS type A sorting domain-containing protein [Bacteroidia bacterium]
MRFIPLGLCFLAVVFISFTHPQGKSTGAPASSTGAPDEFTCNISGCHDDALTNQGDAQLYLTCSDFQQGLIPGKTYSIICSISKRNTQRFGFQLVALDEAGNQAGKFDLLESNRTQILYNDASLKDRQYVTYTYPGTKAVAEDLGQWTVYWTAPKHIAGKVSFYLAGVAANDDASDKGDEVYTFQKHVLPGNSIELLAFPNPFRNTLTIQWPFTQIQASLKIWNKEGVLVFEKEIPNALGQSQTLEEMNQLASGIYFLELSSGSFQASQKLIKE